MSETRAPTCSLLDLGLPATVTEVVARARNADPAAEALVTARVRWSYQQLHDETERAAATLAALGLRPGDRLAVSMGNHAEIVVLFLAAMRVGAVWVGLNQPLAPPEKMHILNDAEVGLVVAAPTVVDELRAVGATDNRRIVTVDPGGPDCEWTALVREHGDGPRPAADARGPFDPAVISYTSGTTGRPKGVVQSEHNIVLPGAVLSRGSEWGLGARIGVCLPLTISNMLVMGPLMTAQTGAACVCTDRLPTRELAAWVERERVESMTLVPTMLHDLIADESVDPSSFATLRYLQTGGGPWSPGLVDRFAERFGIRVVGTYGLTEAPTNVALEHRDRPRVLGASGRPNEHLDVSIRSPEGTRLGPGEVGEVCVAPASTGPFAGVYRLMLGYLHQPEATAATLAGGMLHTGDRGYLDDDGNLFLVGRGSELILRGGANVYPAEVELALVEHPAVAGAAVVGVDDERLGQRVVAVLETTADVDDDELRAHCRARLARYKVPSAFVRVAALPRNSMGKVIRAGVLAAVRNEPSAAETSPTEGEHPR